MTTKIQPQQLLEAMEVTKEEEMPLAILEVLAEHAEQVNRQKNTTDLAEYVSNELAGEYPRVLRKMYKLKREVMLVPKNVTEILKRFFDDWLIANSIFAVSYVLDVEGEYGDESEIFKYELYLNLIGKSFKTN